MASLYIDRETGEWGYQKDLIRVESDEFHDAFVRNTAEVIEWLNELSTAERALIADDLAKTRTNND